MKLKSTCFAGFLAISTNCLSMTTDSMRIFAECQVAAFVVSADWKIKGDYSQSKFWESYGSNVFSKYLNELNMLDLQGKKFWIKAHDEVGKSLINQYMTMGNSQMPYAVSALRSQDCSALSK